MTFFVNNHCTKDFKSCFFIPSLLKVEKFPFIVSDFTQFSDIILRYFYSFPDSCFRVLQSKIIRKLSSDGCEIYLDIQLKGTYTYYLPQYFIDLEEMNNSILNDTNKVNLLSQINYYIDYLSSYIDDNKSSNIFDELRSLNIVDIALKYLNQDTLINIYKQNLKKSKPYIIKEKIPKLNSNQDFSNIDLKGIQIKLHL